MDEYENGLDDGRSESPNQRADRNWNDILQELRVTQTGTQVVAGFLLALAFQSRFDKLDRYQVVVYLALVTFAALATIIGLALVSLHRSYFRKQQKAHMVNVGSRLLVANLVVVGVMAVGVAGFVFDVVLGHVAGLVACGVGILLIFGLWLVIPWQRQPEARPSR